MAASTTSDGESYEYPEGVGPNDGPIPEGFTLERPQPNPFNTMTLFAFTIPVAGDLEVKAYDVTGRMVFNDRLGSVSCGWACEIVPS